MRRTATSATKSTNPPCARFFSARGDRPRTGRRVVCSTFNHGKAGLHSMNNKKLQMTAAAAAFSLLLTPGALAQKKYDTGASDTEIKIGNVEAYSGPASAYGIIGKTEEAY